MEKKVKIKQQSKGYLFWKRFFDIVLSSIALVCFSPVFLVVFILSRFRSEEHTSELQSQR